jgi:hypothetical protein
MMPTYAAVVDKEGEVRRPRAAASRLRDHMAEISAPDRSGFSGFAASGSQSGMNGHISMLDG